MDGQEVPLSCTDPSPSAGPIAGWRRRPGSSVREPRDPTGALRRGFDFSTHAPPDARCPEAHKWAPSQPPTPALCGDLDTRARNAIKLRQAKRLGADGSMGSRSDRRDDRRNPVRLVDGRVFDSDAGLVDGEDEPRSRAKRGVRLLDDSGLRARRDEVARVREESEDTFDRDRDIEGRYRHLPSVGGSRRSVKRLPSSSQCVSRMTLRSRRSSTDGPSDEGAVVNPGRRRSPLRSPHRRRGACRTGR